MVASDYTFGLKCIDRIGMQANQFQKWQIEKIGHCNRLCKEVTIGFVGDAPHVSVTPSDRDKEFVEAWQIRGCEVKQLKVHHAVSLNIYTTSRPTKSAHQVFNQGRAGITRKHKAPKVKLADKLYYGAKWAEQFPERN